MYVNKLLITLSDVITNYKGPIYMDMRQTDKRAPEEAERLTKEQARKKTWLAQEKVIAEATEARRARENKNREGE